MDRASLEAWLTLGLSLEEIGRRVGRHPSTVAYWVKKHGLEAANKNKHAARGAITRERLEELVEGGLSVRGIASSVERSPAAVRYWLGRYGLYTKAAENRQLAKRAKRAGRAIVVLECRHHGRTEFWLEGRGSYRCLRCRWERVARRRREIKAALVREAGGRCRLCGYQRYLGALSFHHLDPAKKLFSLAEAGATRSMERMRAEAAKCMLLCANCHAEVEAGVSVAVVTDGADD